MNNSLTEQPRVPLHQWNAARRKHPGLFNQYDVALFAELRAAKRPEKDTRSIEQKMTDQAIVQAAHSAVQETPGINSQTEMEKAVRIAYGSSGSLDDKHIMALAMLCWELKLSPNPALGHVWMIPNGKDKSTGKDKVIIMPGVYGLINLARRDHEFILREPRLMTDDERTKNGLEPGDVGVICPIIDMRQARPLAELAKAGLPVRLEDAEQYGIGIWKKNVKRWDKETRSWVNKEDNVWQGGTPFLTARKRAIAAALKLLGLNSGVGLLPDLERYGFKYSAYEGAYVTAGTEDEQPDFAALLEDEYQAQLTDGVPLEETPPMVVETTNINGTPRPYAPEMLQEKFNSRVGDRSGERLMNPDLFLTHFGDVTDTPDEARRFILAISGKGKLSDLLQQEGNVLLAMLKDKDAARKEIADYLAWIDAQTPAEPVH